MPLKNEHLAGPGVAQVLRSLWTRCTARPRRLTPSAPRRRTTSASDNVRWPCRRYRRGPLRRPRRGDRRPGEKRSGPPSPLTPCGRPRSFRLRPVPLPSACTLNPPGPADGADQPCSSAAQRTAVERRARSARPLQPHVSRPVPCPERSRHDNGLLPCAPLNPQPH
jgi:hypothetical protein